MITLITMKIKISFIIMVSKWKIKINPYKYMTVIRKKKTGKVFIQIQPCTVPTTKI